MAHRYGPKIVRDGLVFVVDGANKKSGFQYDSGAASFGGTNYLEGDSILTTLNLTTQGSQCGWFKTSDITPSALSTLWGSGIEFGDRSYLTVNLGTDGNMYVFYSYKASNRWFRGTTSPVISNDTWHFVCFTHDGVEPKFYIDDVLITGATSGNDLGWWYDNHTNEVEKLSTFWLGATTYNNFGEIQNFNGELDNVAVWDRDLTTQEMTDLYNNGNGTNFDDITTQKSGLISWWSFNDPSGSRIDRMGVNPLTDEGGVTLSEGHISEPFSFDYVKNMIDGSLGGGVNGASLENTSNTSTRVWEFDGVNDYIDLTFDPKPSLSNHTTEFWIKFADIIDTDLFLVTAGGRYQLRRDTDHIRVVFNGNTVTGAQTPASSILADTWYHIVSTIDIDIDYNEVYINGILSATLNYTSPILTSTGNSVIGNSGGSTLNGSVGSMKYYDKVLTSSEILQNYDETKYRFL